MSIKTGGCMCGQIRYRIASDPGPSRICWCRDCQHISSNGTVNVIFPTSSIEISGKVGQHIKAADSGNQVTRRFCPQCGTQLFSDSTGRPGLTVVRVGTLDDPSSIKPTAYIWTASAPSWACLDSSLERYERQAPPPPPANSAA